MAEPDFNKLLLLLCSWLAYFFVHTLLASLTIKKWFSKQFPEYFHWYRLGYNLIAIVLLIVPLVLTFIWRSELIIDWQGPFQWVSWGLTLIALLGFAATASIYDGGHFLGIAQVKQKEKALLDQEQFTISWFHHYVRHPWYFLGLLFIWSRDMDIYQLTSTGLVSLYLVIGSYLEEKKLICIYGQRYREYCRKVPGLIPVPWKFLTKQQAQSLLEKQVNS